MIPLLPVSPVHPSESGIYFTCGAFIICNYAKFSLFFRQFHKNMQAYIASALFSFGTDACANGITTLFGTGDFLSTDLALKKSALNSLGLGELITVWFISLIVHLGVMIMMVAIVIVLASRIIEVFMYLGVAPIPRAAMLDSGEWSGIGKNWIKQLLALSFQGFFIIIALGIFKTLFSNAIASLNSSTDGIILQMAMLLGYTVALIFTVLRTGAVSKSIFNAH